MTITSHYRDQYGPDYVTARLLLKRNQPIPVDLQARLEAEGYDLNKLKDK